MKRIPIAIVCIVLALGISSAMGEERVARTPTGALQSAADNTSQGQAAIQRAAAANKYVFIFFWNVQNQQTDKAWTVLQSVVNKMADQADVVSIQTTNSTEKTVVDRYGVSRAPIPLVMAVAPCGAITKAFTGAFDEKKLQAAFVSPCTQQCLKALQDRKLVLVCVSDQTSQPEGATLPQGVRDFKADKQYGPVSEIVLLNAREQSESAFMKELGVEANSAVPVTVLLAPPGSTIGKFDAKASKQQIIAKLVSAQSNPCAGGKCGPNGCGPKK
jgi:hypothetical protein